MKSIQIIGNVGRDAVLRESEGKRVLSFSVAVNEKYRDKNGVQHERSEWYECAKWNNPESIAQYIKSGVKVYVSGVPALRVYTGNDGVTKACITINVMQIHLLGGSANNTASNEGGITRDGIGGAQTGAGQVANMKAVHDAVANAPRSSNDDDLPF